MDGELKIEGKDEIEKALREFEEKSALQQTQKSAETSKDSDVPKMVGWVMKLSGGAITEQRTAEYVLLALVILMIAVSFFLFFLNGASNDTDIKQQKLFPPGLPVIR